jgi:hypothetical protein
MTRDDSGDREGASDAKRIKSKGQSGEGQTRREVTADTEVWSSTDRSMTRQRMTNRKTVPSCPQHRARLADAWVLFARATVSQGCT